MADLLFDLNQISKPVANVDAVMQLNPKKANWRSAVQRYFHFLSK